MHNIFVVGTRAQLIKMAPVIVCCERAGMPVTLLMTGQHQETMLDLLNEFDICSSPVSAVPAIERASIGLLMRWFPVALYRVTRCIRELAHDGCPVNVLIHGDTLSTLIGALAGRRSRACVVHLESGLTSGKLLDPFPEEILRRFVFRLTDLAMCPNETSAGHMRERKRVVAVNTHGNTIVDAVAMTGAAEVKPDTARPYVVVSLHRFQNIYDERRLIYLVDLVEDIAKSLPVHFVLHPATMRRLKINRLHGRLQDASGVELSPRLGYSAFLKLAAGAACVLTDGGSNQEELAALGVPTLVMRARTERPDGLGSNAMMEADVPGGVAAFVKAGLYIKLRRIACVGTDEGPSIRIIKALSAAR